MEEPTQNLKELYEKDFYLWVQENLRLLKNREYDLVDWENLLEEIEDMGRSLATDYGRALQVGEFQRTSRDARVGRGSSKGKKRT
jgi:hypothetical protein